MEFITGGPLVALVLEGHEAVGAARQVIGATNPLESAPGSIRGDFGLEVQTNLVHGSDSPESAAREVALFFPELVSRLILASRSPQRSAILEQLGIPFRVVVPGVEELADGDPRALVEANARAKARAVPATASWCSPRTPPWCSTGAGTASRATLPRPRGCCAPSPAAPTR